MNIIKKFLKYFKKYYSFSQKFRRLILHLYFRSIIYRKRHIKKDNYKWLKDIDLIIFNKKEGKLKYKNLQFILPKNDFKTIPLHQKYLYAALISNYNIPKYYLLFWDDLIVFHEIFIENVYNRGINIENGDIILDIGASMGWYACKVSELAGERGKIIAIEPNPYNYYYLKKNVKINNLNNIILLNLGIWSCKKKLKFRCNKYGSSLKNIINSRENNNIIEIDVDTIDNIVSNLKLERVNLIQMDIEGSEIEALKGAKETLKKSDTIKLTIAAYHKNSSGIENYKILVPILEKMKFKILKKYLPFIIGWK